MDQISKDRAEKISGYRIKDTYPGRAFSAEERRRIAAQISSALAGEKEGKDQKHSD